MQAPSHAPETNHVEIIKITNEATVTKRGVLVLDKLIMALRNIDMPVDEAHILGCCKKVRGTRSHRVDRVTKRKCCWSQGMNGQTTVVWEVPVACGSPQENDGSGQYGWVSLLTSFRRKKNGPRSKVSREE